MRAAAELVVVAGVARAGVKATDGSACDVEAEADASGDAIRGVVKGVSTSLKLVSLSDGVRVFAPRWFAGGRAPATLGQSVVIRDPVRVCEGVVGLSARSQLVVDGRVVFGAGGARASRRRARRARPRRAGRAATIALPRRARGRALGPAGGPARRDDGDAAGGSFSPPALEPAAARARRRAAGAGARARARRGDARELDGSELFPRDATSTSSTTRAPLVGVARDGFADACRSASPTGASRSPTPARRVVDGAAAPPTARLVARTRAFAGVDAAGRVAGLGPRRPAAPRPRDGRRRSRASGGAAARALCDVVAVRRLARDDGGWALVALVCDGESLARRARRRPTSSLARRASPPPRPPARARGRRARPGPGGRRRPRTPSRVDDVAGVAPRRRAASRRALVASGPVAPVVRAAADDGAAVLRPRVVDETRVSFAAERRPPAPRAGASSGPTRRGARLLAQTGA
ncbi:hypothetical protein JL720_2936 [Aureococcus anophagefferens]|nr:hypothetical protein JL720_2936 [Aureococcus anophagefferens]